MVASAGWGNSLHGLNEGKQLRSVNQTNGFASGKILCVAREFPRRDDDGFVGTNSTITFRDPAATNSTRRFYRAATP